MPFEFKKARTPRQQQADNVKRRVHQPALAAQPFGVSDYAGMTPYKIAAPPKPMSGGFGFTRPKKR